MSDIFISGYIPFRLIKIGEQALDLTATKTLIH